MRSLVQLCILSAFVSPLTAGFLALQAVDGEGYPVWARFEVRSETGRMYQPAFALRDRSARNRRGGPWYVGSFVAKTRSLIELPDGKYKVIAERGTEYKRFEQEVEVKGEEPVELVVEVGRWIDMNSLGWYSGDFHVHRPLSDVPALVEAEGINLAAVFTMWNKRDLLEGKDLPIAGLERIAPNQLMTINNAEDERGGGAWMMHMLREKLELAVDGRWFPLGLKFIQEAKAQRYVPTGFPWIDLEKPFWKEAPVVMALAQPDSMGLLHNHFNQYGMNDNEAWGRPRDEEKYPDNDGFMRNSTEINYRFWNLGLEVPISAGSASGVLPNPVGYNRVYVRLNEPFAVEPFYRELRQGRSFVTNGPMLFFDGIRLPGGGHRATIDVRSRDPLDRIEVIANGNIVQTFTAPEGKSQFSTEIEFAEDVYSWIAVRAFAKNDETVRMAHSQPYWTGSTWAAGDDARYFIEWMDELIAETEGDAERFKDDAEKAAVLDAYRQARQFYVDRR